MTAPIDWAALVVELKRRHGLHTLLLYGSRARGDDTPASDVDLIGIRTTGGATRDVSGWRGHALDLHVHDEAGVDALLGERTPDLLHARVLSQADGYGDRFVARVRERLSAPPAQDTPDEWKALWAWSSKMRTRIRHPDSTLAAYHRAVLLVESLPSWARVRRRWFLGGKSALGEIRDADPALFSAYAAASAPGAPVAALEALLDRVFDPSAAAVPPPEGFGRAPG